MSATLIWNKMVQGEKEGLSSEQAQQEALDVCANMEMLSWASVEEMEILAEEHGVIRRMWPIYPDCEIKSEIPLEEARQRSAELRIALRNIDPCVVEGSYWLKFVDKILRDGNYFFIMI